MHPALYALAIPVLTLGGLLVAGRSAPAPSRGGGLNPVPNPEATSVPGLLARANILLTQASQNPNSVDPNELEALAAQLRTLGQPAVALQLEAAANFVRLSRSGQGGQAAPIPNVPGGLPIPNIPNVPIQAAQPTATNAALDQQAFLLAADAEAALRNQVPAAQINTRPLDLLLPTLRAAGLNERANQIDVILTRISAKKIGLDLGPNQNPSALDPAFVARLQAADKLRSSVEAESLLNILNTLYPTGFLQMKQQLQSKIADLKAQGV